MPFLSNAVREVWKGILQAAGGLLLVAGGSWLIARIPTVRDWATIQLLTLGAPSRASLTIFLVVSSAALLGLWIAARISLYRLRGRAARNALTLADIMGGKRAAINGLAGQMAPSRRIPDRHEKQERILLALRNREMTDDQLAVELSLSQESVRFHIEALFDDDFLNIGNPMLGYPYSLAQKGRAYLDERNLLE